MRYNSRFRSLFWLLSVGLLMAFSFSACGPGQIFGPTATPTAMVQPTTTPTPPRGWTIIGQIESWEEAPIAGRKIVLCQVIENKQVFPADCVLTRIVAISDDQGRFQVYEVPAGTYFLLYNSGYGNFEDGIERWAGEVLKLGDPKWLFNEYAPSDVEGKVTILVPQHPSRRVIELDPAYLTQALLIGESSFILAHDIEKEAKYRKFVPIFANISENEPVYLNFQVMYVSSQ